MDAMEWALFALDYLRRARSTAAASYNDLQRELREYAPTMRREPWFSPVKNIILTMGAYTDEFPADGKIPGERYASPSDVREAIVEYRSFVAQMDAELVERGEKYMKDGKLHGYPHLVDLTLERTRHVLAAIDYVIERGAAVAAGNNDLSLIADLSKRFHEAVLTLGSHPHGGETLTIENEWDCQYLFRAILTAYFRDVRIEEPNPSFAGTTSRCEFYIKSLRTLVELKYARKANDNKKFLQELAVDLLQYGANPDVDHVVVLIYDPASVLLNPVQLQVDLAGPTKGLEDVRVVISPPR